MEEEKKLGRAQANGSSWSMGNGSLREREVQGQPMSVSVVISTYTEARWDDFARAVDSARAQTVPTLEVVVVVDHNPALLTRVRQQMPFAVVVENLQVPGLSGCRNSGVAAARGELIAFLDDDAVAEPDWLEHLSSGYERDSVLGVGGSVEPMWLDARPRWFPIEFDWVVGCTYRGMPDRRSAVRNPVGANMSFRREVISSIGGFRFEFGRAAALPTRCDETEFCIRAHQRWPESVILYEPRAKIHHLVPSSRARWRYFILRCYVEGLSKARVARLTGARDGLASERVYVSRALPTGCLRGLADTVNRRDPAGLARAGTIVIGLLITTLGYVVGSAWGLARRRSTPPPASAALLAAGRESHHAEESLGRTEGGVCA